MAISLSKFQEVSVVAGVNADNTYPDGTSVEEVAINQEFGNPANNTPPRSFIRSTTEAKRGSWFAKAHKGAKDVLNGESTPQKVMDEVGRTMVGDIVDTIENISNPPLADATIQKRQRNRAKGQTGAAAIDKPLIDQGILVGSIDHEVIE